jgi:hypothetical protein
MPSIFYPPSRVAGTQARWQTAKIQVKENDTAMQRAFLAGSCQWGIHDLI